MRCIGQRCVLALSIALVLAAKRQAVPACYSWSLPNALDRPDTLATFVLTDSVLPPGNWKHAMVRGQRTASRDRQPSLWRSPTPDSVLISWRNPFTTGHFRLIRTATGLNGTLTWTSDVVARDSTGQLRAYRETEAVRAVTKPCPA